MGLSIIKTTKGYELLVGEGFANNKEEDGAADLNLYLKL